MSKKNVLLLFGGCSTEHEVSKLSANTILANLDKDKYNVVPVYITKEGNWLLYDGPITDVNNINWEKFGINAVLSPDRTHKGLLRIVGPKVNIIPIDVVFPIVHGGNGEDGALQGLFQLLDIPYVGSGVASSAICMDKAYTKKLVQLENINVGKFLVFKQEDLSKLDEMVKQIKSELGYPCFVKPVNGGSSIGINKAKNKKSLEEAINIAFSYDNKILVEKAIVGREVECAVLGSGGADTIASGVGEIISSEEIYSYDAKYNSSESLTITNPDIPEKIKEQIKSEAIKIFKTLDCVGLSRVDFFYSEKEGVVFNEINTLPGFTAISMYPMLWKCENMATSELIDKLINLAK